MTDVTFITGNQNKADYLAKYLSISINHQKVDLDEIQTLDLRKVVEHKVKQAYAQVQSPVLVEDVSLEFSALGRFPGTFIKFLIEEVPLETICRTLDGLSREAIGRCVFGFYDGNEVVYFEGKLNGKISEYPAGDNGFGWDKIFIPEGYSTTRAELNDEDYKTIYMKIRPIYQLKNFFDS